ncbi:MAG TPA: hypothetical protein VE287_09015, partial [Actinopolymorphaceae bacterium]|nr:hypothetical protein [Actinopolymorphaceae bacterium]
MAEQQDDSARPSTSRRSWVRSLAMFGLAMVALAAVTETITLGKMRTVVGGFVILALVALVIAGVGWMFEPRE